MFVVNSEHHPARPAVGCVSASARKPTISAAAYRALARSPDRVRGDGGQEAYRLDCGTVYQCYAPEDAFTPQAQTDAQKNKIQRDIHKLVDKPDETVELLGNGYLVTRWVLLTPEYDDKELIKYARAKSEKTRSITPPPPWCGADFQMVVAIDKEERQPPATVIPRGRRGRFLHLRPT